MSAMRGLLLNRFFSPAVTAGCVLLSTAAGAQAGYEPKILPPAKRAARVQITEGPELESIQGNSAIVRWTSNNPGGADEHFGVAYYGTDPNHLDQTAKSHIRLNQYHPTTVFRVMISNLQSKTTYYYKVDSMGGDGTDDRVKSPVKNFSVP
jgi:hypothetical protein